MKKLFVLFLFMSFINVYADKCTYDQKVHLKKEVSNIKIDFEEKEKKIQIDNEEYKFETIDNYLELAIYNIPQNFILEITNDINDDKISVFDADVNDGKYIFNDYNYNRIINYKVEIYNTSVCDMHIVKTINYKKPMFNPNYAYDICKENNDIPFCNKLIYTEKKIYKMGVGLNEAINNYRLTNNEKIEDNNEQNWFIDNIGKIITASLFLFLLTFISIFIIRKRGEL